MARKINPHTNEPYAKYNIRSFGLQARIARRTGLSAPIVSFIFNGVRRATIEQAAKLEEAFNHFGIRINRLDLMYDVRNGESLIDYMDRRGGKE